MELRDYQQKAVDQIRNSILAGKRKPILVMPTGSGKTRTATEIVQLATAKGKFNKGMSGQGGAKRTVKLSGFGSAPAQPSTTNPIEGQQASSSANLPPGYPGSER